MKKRVVLDIYDDEMSIVGALNWLKDVEYSGKLRNRKKGDIFCVRHDKDYAIIDLAGKHIKLSIQNEEEE